MLRGEASCSLGNSQISSSQCGKHHECVEIIGRFQCIVAVISTVISMVSPRANVPHDQCHNPAPRAQHSRTACLAHPQGVSSQREGGSMFSGCLKQCTSPASSGTVLRRMSRTPLLRGSHSRTACSSTDLSCLLTYCDSTDL